MPLITFACFLCATSAAIAQTTATEEFENETAGSTTFSEGTPNINFTHTFTLLNAAGFGYAGSNKYLELKMSGINTKSATISINNALNPSVSFKINSFAGYVAGGSSGSPAINGAVTVSGTPVGSSTGVSATINIASATGGLPPGQTRDVNGVVDGLNFTGTALAGLYFTSLTFTINDNDIGSGLIGTSYFELDHLNFTSAAATTNQFSISDASVIEGSGGAKSMTFTISRTTADAACSVQVQSSNGTATSGNDYTAFPLTTINFAAGGPLSQTVNVTINGDLAVETNETFNMTLSNPTGGTIFDGTGVGTITDDDNIAETFEDEAADATSFSELGFNFKSNGSLVVSSGNNVGAGNCGCVNKALDTRIGNGGSTGSIGSFFVNSAGTSFNLNGIDVFTSNNDGTTGTTANASVTFTGAKADGSGSVSYTATIAPISGDNFQTVSFAGTPFANVQLLSVAVTLGSGINYIALDNIKFGIVSFSGVQLSISDVNVLEGTGGGTTTATFTVTRSNNSSAFSVNVASADLSATAGVDYTAYSSTLNFVNGGSLSQTVMVTILRDALIEGNETFNLTLSGATNGVLYQKPVGLGTILDDDKAIETFEGETDDATTFSENGITFSATNRFKVNISQNSGSGSSQGYLSSSASGVSPNTGGSQGKIIITSPNKGFKLLSLDAWTATGTTPTFVTGPVTFTGTLFGGGTVSTTITITPTSDIGSGWQQNINFAGTPLENAVLNELDFIAGGTVTTIEIDNINYAVVAAVPYIEVTDTLNNAITNGGAATTTNNTDFGTTCTSGSVSKTFTIKNTGSASLTLSGSPLAVLSGTNVSQFSIISQPVGTVAANGSTTITVGYSPTAPGTHSATITLTSNDATNSPYVINIKGTARDASLAISNQPATSTRACTGSTVSFTAIGGGGGTLSYQWYKGTTALTDGASGTGSLYAGTTTNTLTISNISAFDNATNYYMTVANSCAAVTSTNASLTAISPPAVTRPTVTQPTCALSTGTIVVNATGSGTLEYSKDGTNWQTSNMFSGLASGNYIISVRIQGLSGCAVSSNQVVINAAPTAPTLTAPTLTHPTCAVTSGTIVVSASGEGTLEYSNDGGLSWQSSNTFSGLAPGSYNIAARIEDNTTCIVNYTNNPVVIRAVPTLPDVTAPTVTLPTCATPSGTIVVNATGESALEYSSDGGTTWQSSNSFTGLAPNSYNIYVRLQNSLTCVSSYNRNPVVIDAAPPAPAVNAPTITEPTCSVSTGTIVVNATGGTLEYSKDGGTNWQSSNTFSGLTVGNYSIAVRLQNNTTCVTSYSQNPVVLNAPTGCIAPPHITCPANITTPADANQCSKLVSFAASTTGGPAPSVVYKVGRTVITSPYTFPVGTTTVTCTATNVVGTDNCSFTVTIVDNQPPVIHTVTTPIVLLWSPKSKYQTMKASQFVTSVNDNCGTISTNNVVITKVSSDEPDDAAGSADGSTTQDIKIASTCKSVDLRGERLDGGNGRVYTIYLKVTDSKGNIGTATAYAFVPVNQSGTTAIDDDPVYTVNSSCNTISVVTQSKSTASPSATAIRPKATVTVQNYPNPFSSFTTICYQLPAEAQVSLAVYSALGQKVAHLVNGQMSAGKHTVRFDATGRVGGIYLYRLQTKDAEGRIVQLSGKMVIMK